MTLLSLCSGYGGLDTAVEETTGVRTSVYAENNPFASKVMAARFPGLRNLGDITTIDWEQAVRDHSITMIAAGFPCQGLSNAGLRKGLLDARSAIWKNVAEAIRVIRPSIVFLENVAAIRSRGLAEVIADLATIGYDARWTCLRAGAPEIGAPHARDRWFAVAYPAAEDPDISAWGQRWTAAPRQAQSGRARPDARGRSGLPAVGRPLADTAVKLLPTPAARDWKSGASNLFGTNSRLLNEVVVNLLPTPKASDGPYDSTGAHNSHGRYYLPGQAVRLDPRWIGHNGVDYGPAIHRWEHITGRIAPCPTEPGMRGNRRLSPAFVEWMMGLPAGWVTDVPDISRKEQLRILGNGVVPRQAVEGYRILLNADWGPVDK